MILVACRPLYKNNRLTGAEHTRIHSICSRFTKPIQKATIKPIRPTRDTTKSMPLKFIFSMTFCRRAYSAEYLRNAPKIIRQTPADTISLPCQSLGG